jgi:hypothetical protein
MLVLVRRPGLFPPDLRYSPTRKLNRCERPNSFTRPKTQSTLSM